MTEEEAKQADPVLDPRVPLAAERTLLAYERTQIAWIRTALALITFGFAIAQFFAYLRAVGEAVPTALSPRTVGLIMIVIGLVGLIVANWQHRRAIRALRRRHPELPLPVSSVMATLIALLGVLALVGILVH